MPFGAFIHRQFFLGSYDDIGLVIPGHLPAIQVQGSRNHFHQMSEGIEGNRSGEKGDVSEFDRTVGEIVGIRVAKNPHVRRIGEPFRGLFTGKNQRERMIGQQSVMLQPDKGGSVGLFILDDHPGAAALANHSAGPKRGDIQKQDYKKGTDRASGKLNAVVVQCRGSLAGLELRAMTASRRKGTKDAEAFMSCLQNEFPCLQDDRPSVIFLMASKSRFEIILSMHTDRRPIWISIRLFLLFIAIAWIIDSAKADQHLTETNILYRTGELTDYMRERCRLDIHYPTGKSNLVTVVWWHGGSLTGGNREIPGQLRDRGIIVVAPSYRLSPQEKSPAYIEDAAAAVAWTYAHLPHYGGSDRLVFLSGHSAGGYLASMVGLDRRWLAPYGIDPNHLAGLVPFSGQAITHFTIRAERGIPDTTPLIDDFAPIHFVRKDAPPLLLITGDRERELLGRYEENAYFWRMMQLVGHPDTHLHELGGFNHVQMMEPAFPLLMRFIAAHSGTR